MGREERRVLAALLLTAARDAKADDPLVAGPARRWLADEGAGLAEMLDIPPGRVTAFLEGLEPLPWEQTPLFEL